jgi:IS30 family transposase
MDIHDMGARLKAGNRHLLVIVDRASKFLFAYPLPNNSAEGVAKNLLELLLTLGVPSS